MHINININIEKPILFVTDIDHTLLKDRTTIGEKTKATIHKASVYKNGELFKFALATGRPWTHLTNIIQDLKINNSFYAIACNGAAIYDIIENKVLSYKPFAKELLKKIWDIYRKHTNYSNIHSLDNSYRTSNSKLTNAYESWIKFSTKYIDTINDVKEDDEICKVATICLSRAKWEKLRNELREKLNDEISIIDSRTRILEIMPAGSDKLFGVQYLQKHLNIEDDQVIVVGDHSNDVEMLKFYKNSFAVKNANEAAVQAANNKLDLTNKDDAIAELLLKILN